MESAPHFFVRPESLATRFDPGTYERGRDVLRLQRVRNFELNFQSSSEWHIDGQVDGTGRETYDVSVDLEALPGGEVSYFKSTCSCPVRSNCKHAVALTLKTILQASRGPKSAAAPAAQSNSRLDPAEVAALLAAQMQAKLAAKQEREAAQAEHKVVRWLDLFGEAAAPPTSLENVETSRDQEYLVYTLSSRVKGPRATLIISACATRKLPSGMWAKLKPPRQAGLDGSPLQDVEILQLIESLGLRERAYSRFENTGELAGRTGTLALELATASGRLYAAEDDRIKGKPLLLGPAQALRFVWCPLNPKATKAELDPQWILVPELVDPPPGCEWFANSPPLYWNLETGQCGRLGMPGVPDEHLALLMAAPPIAQSAFEHHATQLLQRLAGVALPPMMAAPEVIQGTPPEPMLRISKVASADVHELGLLTGQLRFAYGELVMYAAHNETPILIDLPAAPGEKAIRALLHRDREAEKEAHNRLRALGFSGDNQGNCYLLPIKNDNQQWLRWLDDDFAELKKSGFTVLVGPDLNDFVSRADSLEVRLAAPSKNGVESPAADGAHPTSDSPWFDLSVGIAINGERRNILPLLPQLLAELSTTVQAKKPGATEQTSLVLPEFVYLEEPGGGYLRLPTEPLKPWLQALLELVGDKAPKPADLQKAGLRLSRLEALRLGASLGAGAQWQGAAALQTMIAQLAGRSALPEVTAPDGLMADLRPYQLQGLAWLQFLRSHSLGGVLADDMGLGKTLQTLAHVLMEKNAGRLDLPVLVIAPVSLMGNWRKEAARFTPSLKTLVLHGAERHSAANDMAAHDIVIAPYSLLQRDRERWLAQPWHLVVLDEAQNIKNATSHAALVVSELNTRHRLCLSGTPMENHLGELWSLFHFLMPGFLGSQARFKTLFRTPIEKQGDARQMALLRQRVTPFMLRRNKSDVASDLPDKIESVSSVELSGAQADLYETIRLTTEKAVRDALENKGLAKSHIQVLDALLKLRQVCCDPRLVSLPAAQKVKQSAKLELLMDMLPELLAEGRKVLVFSQFTSMLELIEAELVKQRLSWVKLTGQSQKRDALIERFTSGEVPLFLISLKAGGVGLNLTQADTVIHYDPWWNPAVETQATDRAHRIGQTSQVLVYKLVAQGTIEERILALQERKAALANNLYTGASGEVSRKEPLFTESDLAMLLRPLGE